MQTQAVDQAIERLRLICPEFVIGNVLARTGKCLLIRGALADQVAVAKLLDEPDPYWQARFVREIRWYRFFERHAPPVLVPRLLFANEALAINVLEFLEGQPLDQTRYPTPPLPPSQIEALLDQLARLHNWHMPATPALADIVAVNFAFLGSLL